MITLQRAAYLPINDLSKNHPYLGRLAAIPVVLLDVTIETMKHPLKAIYHLALAIMDGLRLRRTAVAHFKASIVSAVNTPDVFLTALVQQARQVWEDPRFAFSTSYPKAVPPTPTKELEMAGSSIPPEIFSLILKHLEEKDHAQAAQVSQAWNQAAFKHAYNSMILPFRGVLMRVSDQIEEGHHDLKAYFSLLGKDTRAFDVDPWIINNYPNIYSTTNEHTVVGMKLGRVRPIGFMQSVPQIYAMRFKLKEIFLHLLKDLDDSALGKLRANATDENILGPMSLQNFLKLAPVYRELKNLSRDIKRIGLDLIQNNHFEQVPMLFKELSLDDTPLPMTLAAALEKVGSFEALAAAVKILEPRTHPSEPQVFSVLTKLVEIGSFEALVLAAKMVKRLQTHSRPDSSINSSKSLLINKAITNLIAIGTAKALVLAATLVPHLPILQPGNPYYRDPTYCAIAEKLIAIGTPAALTEARKLVDLIQSPDSKEVLLDCIRMAELANRV